MDFKAAIIDLDGVMLDSLGVWEAIDTDFIRRYAIPDGEKVVARLQRTTSLIEAGEYLHGECGHPNSPEDIAREFTELLGEHYRNTLQLFPGVREKLASFKELGIKTAMVTASPEVHAKPAALRTGILGFFDTVYYDEKKTTREIFLRVASELGSSPADTVVFDDNPLLRSVAESAGFRTFAALV